MQYQSFVLCMSICDIIGVTKSSGCPFSAFWNWIPSVKPVLNGPHIKQTPSINQIASKSHFSFPAFTVKNPYIQWIPLLSECRHLKLDFLWSFLLLEICIKQTLQKECPFLFSTFLVDQSLKFANKLRCHRNAIFCYLVLLLLKFCSCLIL